MSRSTPPNKPLPARPKTPLSKNPVIATMQGLGANSKGNFPPAAPPKPAKAPAPAAAPKSAFGVKPSPGAKAAPKPGAPQLGQARANATNNLISGLTKMPAAKPAPGKPAPAKPAAPKPAGAAPKPAGAAPKPTGPKKVGFAPGTKK